MMRPQRFHSIAKHMATFVLIWRAYGVRIDEYARIRDKKLQNNYNLVTKSYKIMKK